VASALGTLAAAGFLPAVLDLAVDKLTEETVRPAQLAMFSVPMHTALRIGMRAAARLRALKPDCRVVFVGHYASLNARALLEGYADYVLSGEFEEPLLRLVQALERGDEPDFGAAIAPWLRKIPFAVPRRETLPALQRYAKLEWNGDTVVAGHTETSRGCRHLCRHCPIPPVYEGRFFVVPREVVLDDIRNQVREGARHITFGDPDFLNGPGHALAIVRAMHEEFPEATFDFTAKIEHLVKHAALLPEFARLGCLFVVSAVESLNEDILRRLDKGHTRADVVRALEICRTAGIALRPTWVAFTPWTSLEDYLEVLYFIETNDLVDHVDPVQFTIRLLVPPGSLLAGDAGLAPFLTGDLDSGGLSLAWRHHDPLVERLQEEVMRLFRGAAGSGRSDLEVFEAIRNVALAAAGGSGALGRSGVVAGSAAATRIHSASFQERASSPAPHEQHARARPRAPRLTEPWFC
jgi:hypothetical protein